MSKPESTRPLKLCDHVESLSGSEAVTSVHCGRCNALNGVNSSTQTTNEASDAFVTANKQGTLANTEDSSNKDAKKDRTDSFQCDCLLL